MIAFGLVFELQCVCASALTCWLEGDGGKEIKRKWERKRFAWFEWILSRVATTMRTNDGDIHDDDDTRTSAELQPYARPYARPSIYLSAPAGMQ